MMKTSRALAVSVALILVIGCFAGCAEIEKFGDVVERPDISLPSVGMNENDDSDSSQKSSESDKKSNIPEEWEDHIFLSGVENGFCESMVGEIYVTFVLLDDAESEWNESDAAETEEFLAKELKKLAESASEYGAEILFEYEFIFGATDKNVQLDDDGWQAGAVNSIGYSSMAGAQTSIEYNNEVSAAPIIFVVNKEGRCFAEMSYSRLGAEFIVLYADGLDAFTHEFCHVFGADDYYYPDEVSAAATEYLPNSIMNDGEGDSAEFDELTRFAIGWEETLGENAEAFLEATKHITAEDMEDAFLDETITGYGTRNYSEGVYTGYMIDGIPHGEGTIVWDNGDSYTGNWSNGVYVGKGKLSFDGGAEYYEGDFSDGYFHGKGKYVWANGDVYEGDWFEDMMHGNGVYTLADGCVYEGEFANDCFNGIGTLAFPDGPRYEGEWKDDRMHGYGIYTFADGDVYEGEFADDSMCGDGKFTWADGTVYEGEWKNDLMNGYGKMTYPDGTILEGNWEDGEFAD